MVCFLQFRLWLGTDCARSQNLKRKITPRFGPTLTCFCPVCFLVSPWSLHQYFKQFLEPSETVSWPWPWQLTLTLAGVCRWPVSSLPVSCSSMCYVLGRPVGPQLISSLYCILMNSDNKINPRQDKLCVCVDLWVMCAVIIWCYGTDMLVMYATGRTNWHPGLYSIYGWAKS